MVIRLERSLFLVGLAGLSVGDCFMMPFGWLSAYFDGAYNCRLRKSSRLLNLPLAGLLKRARG